MKDLIRTAYEVKGYQITGVDSLGSLVDDQRFNIQATMPAGATEKQVPQMLQALLAERFKLVIRGETKDQSVYAQRRTKVERFRARSARPGHSP